MFRHVRSCLCQFLTLSILREVCLRLQLNLHLTSKLDLRFTLTREIDYGCQNSVHYGRPFPNQRHLNPRAFFVGDVYTATNDALIATLCSGR
jgi:hypothetical protein